MELSTVGSSMNGFPMGFTCKKCYFWRRYFESARLDEAPGTEEGRMKELGELLRDQEALTLTFVKIFR